MNRKTPRSNTSRVNDLILATPYKAARTSKQLVPATEEGVLPQNSFHRVSYLPGVSAREAPAKLPRLFIQGGSGGSIKLDLSGVGHWMDQSAFAFSVPDESLARLHIHRGDIAIVEPRGASPKVGNIVLAYDDGREALRQVKKRQGGLRLTAAWSDKREEASFLSNSYLGVVIGIFRYFRQVKPVRYRPDDFQCEPPPEVSEVTLRLRRRRKKAAPRRRGKLSYSAVSQAPTAIRL